MRPSAAEALKAAIRRALPLTAVLVALGVIAVNVQKALAGDKFSADSRIVLSMSDLASAVSGVEPDFTDPERAADTALALAELLRGVRAGRGKHRPGRRRRSCP